MKKFIYLGTCAVLVIIVIILFFLLATRNSDTPGNIPTSISPTKGVPQGETIEISSVPLKNFYKTAAKIDDYGDVYLVSDPAKYQIIYFEEYNSFLISITGSPFEELKKEAEVLLLEKTGMSEAEACGLNIQITTPNFANPDYSGKSYPLSFCQQ